MVPDHRGRNPCGALPQSHDGAGLGQRAGEPIELKDGQTARRLAQIESPRNRLLPRVAALGQMDGGAQPVELMRDGALIGLAGPPGTPRLDPQRLPRRRSRQPALRRDRQEGIDDGAERILGDERKPGPVIRAGVGAGEPDVVTGAALDDTGPRVPPHAQADGRRRRDRRLQTLQPLPQGRHHGDVVAHAHLDAQHEAHALEELDQCGAAPRLGDEPERLGVVQGGERMDDAPLGVQDERLHTAVARRQIREHLAGQGREPGEPVRTGHGDDIAGQNGHRGRGLQKTLLPQGVAVVGGDELVGVADGIGNGTGPVQQRGASHQAVPSVSASAGPSGFSGLPAASASDPAALLPASSAAMAARSAAPGALAGSSGSSGSLTRPSLPEA